MSEILFENELAIVAIVKNESRYINEWLDYHYRIGVDKFYIYNNDSDDTDELMKILQPWIDADVVDIENISGKLKQMPAYHQALQKHRFDCRYIAFIDLDEFIFIKTGQSLPEFLHEHFSHSHRVAGLGINWRMFGTSGKQFYEPIDITERFTFRSQFDYWDNIHIKSIVNPRRVAYMDSPHAFVYYVSLFCADESQKYIQFYANFPNDFAKIQINHYFTKSIQECTEKFSRGRADTGAIRSDDEFRKFTNDLNEVEDTGLRDLYRVLKQQPLPPVKDHSEQKILNNVRQMMQRFSATHLTDEDYQGHAELFLTCFFLIHKSKSVSADDKLNIEKLLIDCLTKAVIQGTTLDEINLLLDVHAELLTVDFKKIRDMFSVVRSVLPSMIELAYLEYKLGLAHDLEQSQKNIDALLNLNLTN